MHCWKYEHPKNQQTSLMQLREVKTAAAHQQHFELTPYCAVLLLLPLNVYQVRAALAMSGCSQGHPWDLGKYQTVVVECIQKRSTANGKRIVLADTSTPAGS